MNALATAINAFERAPAPDPLTRLGITCLVGAARRRLAEAPAEAEQAFASRMLREPIAQNTDEANAQHYELPAAFFGLILGEHRKYSSCFYASPEDALEQAEAQALALTAQHADLQDGQDILELGCGWGSLSLWMAKAYPQARIMAVSNSRSQRAHIEAEARERGLTNLQVVTDDMNRFNANGVLDDRRFDRVVSVEMFEHMANWPALLGRINGWLKPDGRLFLHVFTHKTTPYRFDAADQGDWIAQHFFTGGVMPSQGLIRRFPNLFTVEDEWRWSGSHYERTALDWLDNYDRHREAINVILNDVYGDAAPLWRRRWRLFFLSVAGLFGHRGGEEWGVNHYRLKPTAAAAGV